MELSPEAIKMLNEQATKEKEINATLKDRAEYRAKLKTMQAEELQAEQAKYQTNSKNNMMLAEMLARTGKMAEAAKLRAKAEQEHELAMEAFKASSLSMETKILAVEKARLALKQAMNGTDEQAMANAQLQLATAEKGLAQHKELITDLEEELRIGEERLANLAEITKEYDNLSEAAKKGYDESKGGIESMAKAMFGVIDYQKTAIGQAMVFAQHMFQVEDYAKGVGLALKDAFNPANLGAMAFTKVAESFVMMFLALDKAATKFAEATGTGRQYQGMLEGIRTEGNHLGVTFEDASGSLQGLYDELIGFNALSTETQQNLALKVAGFEMLGIKTNDVADIMNTFAKTMGTSAEESYDLTRNLAMMGTAVGISSQKMIKNFQTANKTIAVYGKGATKVFTNLAAMAKEAGIEMSSLLGVAEKFDTFESAADSVGKLNAILGSQMSSTKMLMMTEDERIETLIQQINASGQTFAQMDRFKQKAIANAAGITDMAEANRLFNMSMSQYREHTKQMKEAETSQAKMEEAMKATVPITEMFQQMLVEFAPDITNFLTVARDLFQMLITGLKTLNDWTAGTFPYIIAGLGGITVAMKVLSGPAKLVSAGIKMVGASSKSVGTGNKVISKTSGPAARGFRVMATGLRALGKAATKAVPFVLAVGGAVLMIGGGIAIAALGVATLVQAFVGLGPAAGMAALAIGLLIIPFVAFFAVMALVVYSGVGPLAAGVMLAMGAAALMLGIGIAIAALGMSVLVAAIGAMGADGIAAAGAFYAIASGMALMMVAAAALLIPLYFFTKVLMGTAVASTLASIGFTGLALGIGATAIASVLLGLGLMVIAAGLGEIINTGAEAILAFIGLGVGMAAMAAGVAAMFVFISNPLGWLAIAAAMAVMSGAIAIFVQGMNAIDDGKLEAMAKLADGMRDLSTMEADQTIIAKVSADLKDFKDTMDASLMAQVATLSVFGDINAMNETKAETKVQQQIQLPPVNLNLKSELTTNIGDTKFADHVHEATKTINWKNSDGAKNIYLHGHAKAVE